MAYEKCIGRLVQAAGRALTDDEVASVFQRIHDAAIDIRAGRVNPQDVGLGPKLEKKIGVPSAAGNTILQEAAQQAIAKIEHEAALRERRAGLQLTALAARMGDRDANAAAGLAPLEAVEKTIFRDFSGRTNVESLEQRATGIRSDLMRKIQPVWDALGNDWLGFFQDREKLKTLIRALRKEPGQDPMATKGAQAFHDAAEQARMAFNAAGGDIGKLDDWGFPQHHSQEKVAIAAKLLGSGGADDVAANRKAWVDYMVPRMMKTAGQGKFYVDEVSGQPWQEPRMREFLDAAWNTISTNGIANLEPGKRGGTSRAGRHAESRQIHFASADDVLEYWNTFGDKTAVEILDGHLDKMARDVAFIEKFGPNPDMTYQTLRDEALKQAATAQPRKTTKFENQAARLDAYWDYSAGRIKPTESTTLSAVADGLSHLNTAGKLGGAAIASFFGDKPIYEAISHLNDIPVLQRWRTEVSMLNPANADDRRALQTQGLMLESVRSGLNRFYGGIDRGTAGANFSSVTGKMANAVMRLTGMSAINDLRKGAFGTGLMAAIGHEIEAGKNFADLPNSDVRVLKNFGVTEVEWKIWQLAQPDTLKIGSQHLVNALTPEAIARIPEDALRQANIIGAADGPDAAALVRRNAIVKLLGAVNTESDFAVVTPGWKERAQFYSRLDRGTPMGELGRAVLQFKSFPWAYFQRGMDLVANAETGAGKAAMTAYLIASTTAAGAMIIQTREMLSGKDPRKVMDERDWYKFWGQAFLQGGALGIYGDFLYGINETRYGSGPLEMMAGPTLGPLLEMGAVQPLKAAKDYQQGKPTHLGAQTLQDFKGFVPGGNVWYAKAAIDHMVWQKVFESLSPGYLGTIRNRTMKDYQQDWWWRPGETAPERAPNLGQAIGR